MTVWTPELDSALRAMVAQKLTTRVIAEVMALHYSTVARRIRALGLLDPVQPAPPVRGSHIADYKKARRGFVVPEHLEREYHELLKTGIPIAAVCEQLGIATQHEKRGE